MGGLGNQMFQYAQARALMEMGISDIQFDVDCISQKTPREYQLRDMDTIDFPIVDKEKVSRFIKFRNLCYSHSSFRTFSKILKYGFENQEYVIQQNKNYSYIDGYWQNLGYFQDLKNELINELKYKWTMTEKQTYILALMEQCNSVAVHVRRGDYLTLDNSNYFNILRKDEYYDIAMRMMRQNFDDVKFFFFSDDIRWCKENFKEYKNTIFVDSEISSTGLEDFELMKKCKHFIISNSTFSWWASWLSDNDGKCAIAPRKWFVDEKKNDRCVKGLLDDYTLI